MKKIFFLLFAAVIISSCDTESLDPGLVPDSGAGGGGGNVDTSLIVGDWLYVDVAVLTTTTTSVSGTPATLTASTEFVSSDAILTFDANGTYSITGDLTIELFNQGVSAGNQTNSFNDQGTYTITGNVLEMVSTAPGSATPFDSTTTVTIDTLDAIDLLLDIDGSSTQNAGGSSIDIVIEGTADFERQ